MQVIDLSMQVIYLYAGDTQASSLVTSPINVGTSEVCELAEQRVHKI